MTQINQVLLVEDDAITMLIIKKLVTKKFPKTNFQACVNGELALHYLRQECSTTHQYPGVILLDINMPVMNGWELLDVLSEDPALKNIPVIMLTSSIDYKDIEKSKTYPQVKEYFSKPLNEESLDKMVEIL